MPRFIKLTQSDLPVLINVELIAFLEQRSHDASAGTEIHFSGVDGDFIRVSETISNVISAIYKAGS